MIGLATAVRWVPGGLARTGAGACALLVAGPAFRRAGGELRPEAECLDRLRLALGGLAVAFARAWMGAGSGWRGRRVGRSGRR